LKAVENEEKAGGKKTMESGEDQLIEIEVMGCALLQFIGAMHQCIAYIKLTRE
jgi:hypothetical protein